MVGKDRIGLIAYRVCKDVNKSRGDRSKCDVAALPYKKGTGIKELSEVIEITDFTEQWLTKAFTYVYTALLERLTQYYCERLQCTEGTLDIALAREIWMGYKNVLDSNQGHESAEECVSRVVGEYGADGVILNVVNKNIRLSDGVSPLWDNNNIVYSNDCAKLIYTDTPEPQCFYSTKVGFVRFSIMIDHGVKCECKANVKIIIDNKRQCKETIV